jgi:hypothetical protein
MRNLILGKARLARGGMLGIGLASEPEPHRVRSASLAIGADDRDARVARRAARSVISPTAATPTQLCAAYDEV